MPRRRQSMGFQPYALLEVYGETSDSIELEDLKYYQTYQAGFEAYLARNFTSALGKFALALQLRHNDPAAKWLISRIAALNPDDLPESWDGSVKLTSK
ncbi:MAG: hypothetical protein GY801_20985 [bacterium]|nr:hypothetical protein [bacterium]